MVLDMFCRGHSVLVNILTLVFGTYIQFCIGLLGSKLTTVLCDRIDLRRWNVSSQFFRGCNSGLGVEIDPTRFSAEDACRFWPHPNEKGILVDKRFT